MNKLIIIFLLFPVLLLAQTEVNVTTYGANGKDQKDDTAAFQKAANSLKNKGGKISIPAGTYYVSEVLFLGKGFNNISIKGNDSKIIQLISNARKTVHNGLYKTFAKRIQADGIFVFDALASHETDDTNSIKNIQISGINFVSDVAKFGFDELLHQISASGVSNFNVNNCTFTGFLGDGIAINAGTDVQTFGYNKDIKITNCKFDGINNDNRQGISIYYADGFLIDRCDFKNITRPGMPGAIDVEPGQNFLVNRNGTISNCTFTNIGGQAAVCFVLPESGSANQFSNKNFTVTNCVFDNVNSALGFYGNKKQYDSTGDQETPIITFKDSSVKNVKIAVELHTAYNVLFSNVIFDKITTVTNNILNNGGKNITFDRCTFKDIKHPTGIGFYGSGKNITVKNSVFENFSSSALTFYSPEIIGKIENNTFTNSLSGGAAINLPETPANRNMRAAAKKKIGKNTYKNTGTVN